MKRTAWRAFVEIAFVVFLFYANLLMGEFERSAKGRTKGLAWAIADIFTLRNLVIAVVAAAIAELVFGFLRKRTG
ncbi:MAG: hypothetical protein JOY93_12235 [Acidobacteriales bacterium]|nr:hypothetical protein [Terriglobales bacterium]